MNEHDEIIVDMKCINRHTFSYYLEYAGGGDGGGGGGGDGVVVWFLATACHASLLVPPTTGLSVAASGRTPAWRTR